MIEFSALTVRKSPLFSLFVVLLNRAILGLAILFTVFQLGWVLPLAFERSSRGLSGDMNIYFYAAVRLQQGSDIYQPWPEYMPEMIPSRFFYSPPFLLLTRPLVELGFQGFSRVWILLIWAAYWIYAACLAKLCCGHRSWKATLVFGALITALFHGDETLYLGQFEPFIWMLLGLALTTKPRAGWLILAAMVKIHPVWALCLTLHRDKSTAWKHMLLFAVPVLLASLWLAGTRNWLMWWPATQPVASQGTFSPFNWSLSFGVLRLAHAAGWIQTNLPLPLGAKIFLAASALGAPLSFAWLARKTSPQMQLALVASAGVFFAPLCWMIYSPILLLPIATALGERRKRLSCAPRTAPEVGASPRIFRLS